MTAYAWFILGQSFVTTALVFRRVVLVRGVLRGHARGLRLEPRGGAAMAFSVGSVVQAASSPLVGVLTDRWGPRVVVVGGLGAMAAGLAACSLVQSLWHLILLFGVAVGFGVGLAGQVSHAALLSRWFAGAAAARSSASPLPAWGWASRSWGRCRRRSCRAWGGAMRLWPSAA